MTLPHEHISYILLSALEFQALQSRACFLLKLKQCMGYPTGDKGILLHMI